MTTSTLEEIHRRAAALAKKHRIDTNSGIDHCRRGDCDTCITEYTLHELAHVIVAGGRFAKDVPSQIADMLSQISDQSADSLEIDTAAVTYLAGTELGMWKQGDSFRRLITIACKKNLRKYRSIGSVAREFGKRVRSDFHREKARELAVLMMGEP